MKFRAKISKEKLIVLYSVVQTLEKISSSNSVIVLNKEFVQIATVSFEGSIDNPRCYAELNIAVLFMEYHLESQANNTILFEINLNQLSNALSSGKNAMKCQIKLVKRGELPCLCFETKAFESAIAADIVHDIPIKIIKASDVIYHQPPMIPPPHVAIDLPKNKSFRTILERMMKFSRTVQITASQSGKMVCKAMHATSAIIQTYYNGLQPRYVGTLSPENSLENQICVNINLKRLCSIVNFNQLVFERASLFLSPHSPVMVHIVLSPLNVGSVSFYQPVLLLDEMTDDEDADKNEGESNVDGE